MSQTESETRTVPTPSDSPVDRIRTAVGDSVLLKLAVSGALLLVFAALVIDGVVAGMAGIFGTALVVLGVVGYAFLWFDRYRS